MSLSEVPAKISVVIPTYNRCDLLEKTLQQLTRQRLPAGEFEVIVSDDGSSDATAAVAESFSGRLQLKYTFQQDLGFRAGTARNAGARLATAPVLAFLDTGSMVGPDFLHHHLAEHGDQATRRVVVGYAYGWNPREPMPGLEDVLRQFAPEDAVARFRDDPAFQDERHEPFLECDFDLTRRVVPWSLFYSLNVSVQAADFWAVGGFDEQFCGWGFEDIELGFRLFRHGLSFWAARDAWVVEWPHERHHVEVNLKEAMVNLGRFLRKHPEPAVELLWLAAQTKLWSCENYYAELGAWCRQISGMDVADELSAASGQIPRGDRVAVIGSGGSIPASLTDAIVMDFDKELLDQALATGRHHGHHVVGLRTPLADQSVDQVIITSRLAGLWGDWGGDLLAEAHRIGRNVRTFEQAGTLQRRGGREVPPSGPAG